LDFGFSFFLTAEAQRTQRKENDVVTKHTDRFPGEANAKRESILTI
jgi:hypothetical protein